jgi:enterochelin esterase family protein
VGGNGAADDEHRTRCDGKAEGVLARLRLIVKKPSACALPVVLTIHAVALRASAEPPIDLDSPRIAALAEVPEADRPRAVEAFWRTMGGRAPLIEPIDNDERRLRVTFIWRGDAATKTVLLMGGLPAATLHKPLSHLRDTDIWYRTERLPATTRITYGFRVNAPPENPSGMDEAVASLARFPPRIDPFNPNKHFMFSVLELPDAPPQLWIKARPEVPRGAVKNGLSKARPSAASETWWSTLPPDTKS